MWGKRDALCTMFGCKYKIGMAVNYVLSSRVAYEDEKSIILCSKMEK